jgi:hypothetical protein
MSGASDARIKRDRERGEIGRLFELRNRRSIESELDWCELSPMQTIITTSNDSRMSFRCLKKLLEFQENKRKKARCKKIPKTESVRSLESDLLRE